MKVVDNMNGVGNTHLVCECNFYGDPEGAKIVLDHHCHVGGNMHQSLPTDPFRHGGQVGPGWPLQRHSATLVEEFWQGERGRRHFPVHVAQAIKACVTSWRHLTCYTRSTGTHAFWNGINCPVNFTKFAIGLVVVLSNFVGLVEIAASDAKLTLARLLDN